MSLINRLRESRLWPMLWKEFLQMRRDRFTLAMLMGIPALQLLLFGYAVRTEVKHLPTVVLDQSNSSQSRALVNVLVNTQNYDVVARVTGPAAMETLLSEGKVRAAIVIPPDFAINIKRGHPASAQIVVDGSDPLTASAAISGGALASLAATEVLGTGPESKTAPLDIRVRPRYNPGLKTPIFIVPGLVGILLTLTMVATTAMSLVRERERGTLEQLIVTPIAKSDVILGKILPFIGVGYVQMTVVLLLGHLVFHVPIRGSLLLLYAVTFAFIFAVLGMGLLISTVARTQTQAIQLSIFMIMPSILLSGFMFPLAAMPRAIGWIGLALPVTYYLEILRGIVLKGVGLEQLWPQTLVLILFGLVLVLISVKRFAKTLE
ncbi:MAG: ABC transporter permease [Gemmatimonadota bacterium]